MESSHAAGLSLVWIAKAATLGALVFQFLEFFSQFVDEIEYLWKSRIRLITCLYAWCRYFPLCGQIVNLVFAEMVHNSPSARLCMTAFILKAITAQLTTICVEAILMVRVHALYNNSRRSGILLLLVLLFGTILEVTGAVLSLANLEPGIGGTICTPAPCSPLHLALFAIGCGLIQGVTLFMTGLRIYFSRKRGWTRTPVVSLMLRDGVSIFVLLAVIISSLIGFEVVHRLGDGVLVWDAAYAWYVSLVSISGCRMILSMRKLGARHPRNRQPDEDSLLEFSTIIYSEELCRG
ncbi:hypothetical protein GALMADRAFT_141169 [Galerina marginata CBS 339.88]|uniref:DUF6533 domain-containing protein n=1 Tax=Galerina marginata (strain CBS 339.88) TaxID=685588 RepID=A0A067SVC7_GALM3|nr:hypothetical protein GALMADRAFT_141169 [Galerina marginata CBS 339.88]